LSMVHVRFAPVFRTIVLLAGFALVGCQPARPPAQRGAAPTRSPAAAQRATPTIQVAAPTVQVVQNGKVTPAAPAVHVFLWGNAATTDRDLRLAREAGFSWVKQRFEWRYIERTRKNAWEWQEADRIVDAVNKAGLGMVVRLDNQPEWARGDRLFPRSGPPDRVQDWEDFAGAVAERYRGKIAAYEIWNEPNLAREWGDARPSPAAYVELLKAGYTAIKKKDPNALVLSAGMSPTTEVSERAMPDVQFIEELYAAGAKQYWDMLGAHAAGFKAEPEADPAVVAQDPDLTNNDPSATDLKRLYAFRHIEDLRAIMVKNGDEAKQIGLMELGWTADPRPESPYAWHSVSEDQKAAYLVRAVEYARANWSPWVGMMTVLYIAGPTWTPADEQYHWSITNPDGSPRPAYEALKGMLGLSPAASPSPSPSPSSTQ